MTRLALLLFFVAACSSPAPLVGGGPLEDDSKADKLVPHGSDVAGELRFTLPPAADANHPVEGRWFGSNDNGRWVVAPGRQRWRPGHYVFTADVWGPSYVSLPFDIVAKQTATIELAGLHLDGVASSELAVDFGDVARWHLDGIDNRPFDTAFNVATRKTLAVAPGFVSITLSNDDGPSPIEITPLGAYAVAGQTQRVDLSWVDPRGKIRVVPPERALEATVGRGATVRLLGASAVELAAFAENSRADVLEKGSSFPASDGQSWTVLASKWSSRHYLLEANGTFAELEVPERGEINPPLRRLDVDDVVVTLEDGSNTTYRGRWSLDWLNPQGHWEHVLALSDMPTATGADLVAGHYRVSVAYSTVEAGWKTDVYDIELK